MPLRDPIARAKYYADYYAKNREAIRSKVRKWRKENPERLKAQGRRHMKLTRSRKALAEIEVIKAEQARRRAEKLALETARGYAGNLTVFQ